jgi:NADPH:quinone reductase-like Zn-dependent oxidoreductase
MKITTEAWTFSADRPRLTLESFSFEGLGEHEVLVEPIIGCWEGNGGHAYARAPLDVFKARNEQKIVLGNAGVVRVVALGSRVTLVKPGDVCMLYCNCGWDKYGYMTANYAYDAPGTIGVLAKTTKMHERMVLPIPQHSRYSLRQWAAFSLRYVTAWSNYRVALHCWRSQITEEDKAAPDVWAWGGGVALAEVQLAKIQGARAAMLVSRPSDQRVLEKMGIAAVDRRAFAKMQFDDVRYREDQTYRAEYREAEQRFVAMVRAATDGEGASIFIDNIGKPVYRATVKALARQGVLATCGWKKGWDISLVRSIETIARHLHVHTHYARYSEAVEAMAFAEEHGWMTPPETVESVYAWEQIGELAEAYRDGRVDGYFPLFQVNAAA